MRRSECPRELEVVAAARNPSLASPDLVVHVGECRTCSDLADVAGAIGEDCRTLAGEARLQPAAVVYWRSQLRARREAARQVTGPIAAFQAVAAASLIGVVGALAGLLMPGVRPWLMGQWNQWATVAPMWIDQTSSAVSGSPLGAMMVVVVGAAVVSVPLAIYLIFSDR